MDAIRQQLEAAGLRLASAETGRAEALSELRNLVRQAAAAHVPVAEIARLGHISRQTVYNFTRGDS